MSRIGKKPIEVPKDVKINIQAGSVQVEGAKGKLSMPVPANIVVKQENNQIVVTRTNNEKQDRANHGTTRAKIETMIEGVTKGHKKELEIQGVGFRATAQGAKILFNLGFSHPIEFDVPKDVKISVPTQLSVIVEGTDKHRVGQVASTIKMLKPVEPYKGKGIRYSGQFVRRKQGKSVTKK